MISIVIVNWNSGRLLDSCVQSVLKNAAGCRIVIVDNASTDASLHPIAGTGADILILRNDQNIGFAAGNNIGWRASEGSHVLFLNPDTECFPGSIQCLEQTLKVDEAVWAAGGHLVTPSGRPQKNFNVRSFPSVRSVAAEILFLDEIRRVPQWVRPPRTNDTLLARDVDQPAAACLMITRAALEKIGGFDEDFRPAWFEDVDLCRRIRNHGGRIQYQPAARFLHHGGYSLGRLTRQHFLEIFHANQIRYFRKHHGFRSATRVKRLVLMGLFLRSALSVAYPLVPNSSRSASAKIFWDAARHLSKLREAGL